LKFGKGKRATWFWLLFLSRKERKKEHKKQKAGSFEGCFILYFIFYLFIFLSFYLFIFYIFYFLYFISLYLYIFYILLRSQGGTRRMGKDITKRYNYKARAGGNAQKQGFLSFSLLFPSGEFLTDLFFP